MKKKPSESYREIEDLLKARRRWEVRILVIEALLKFDEPFREKLERFKMDKDAMADKEGLELRQELENKVMLLERNQTHLYVYKLRLMILKIVTDSLSEEDQEFVRIAYTERFSNEEVLKHLSISNSTFFRRRVEIAERVRLLLGESRDFLRKFVPDEVEPHIEHFYSDEWFLEKKLALPDYLSHERTKQEPNE